MFNRIKEAARILTYREPRSGADAVIVSHVQESPSGPGKVISYILEVLIIVYGIGHIAAPLASALSRFMSGKHTSTSTAILAGALGALLALMTNAIRQDIEQKIRLRLNLSELLAPFFGKKLDNVLRVMKG